jgi:methyltransferase-like protein/SAM-dependent methyltransferase
MSYDSLPYPSLPLVQTHPERIATVATLLGLSPAPVEKCRLLELGCASGGNLLPMAQAFPDSHFVGIDLSPRQIEAGQAMIAELGFNNIELRTMDILELARDDKLAAELGEFDYIITHGVYSWVPEVVQQALLAVCKRQLAPHGVAYVSYNTYPGFYRRQPIRELMMYHVATLREAAGEKSSPTSAEGLRQEVQQARQLLELLEASVPDASSGWGRAVKDEADKLRVLPDAYLGHEHLEPDNRPCYFHEFAARAAGQGLQYLSEAGRLSTVSDCAPALKQLLGSRGDDIIVLEQYMDFVRNQSLRRTLLVHDGLKIDRTLPLSRVKPLWAACAAWPPPSDSVTEADVREPIEMQFRSRVGMVKVSHPAFKCVLIALSNDEPRAQSIAELAGNASALLDAEIDEEAVADILLEAFRMALVSLHVYPPRFTLTISEKPLASPVARLQARDDMIVANLIHEAVKLEPLERLILPLLDGKHDGEALLGPLLRAAQDGLLIVKHNQKPEREAGRLREILTHQIKSALESLAGYALLLS